MKIQDGDFVVTRDRWRIECVKAIRVTAQTVFYMDAHWKPARERRVRIQDAIFSGPEDVAKLLCQQLQSSYQQKVQDQQHASDRQKKRDDAFIEAANRDNSLTSPETMGGDRG